MKKKSFVTCIALVSITLLKAQKRSEIVWPDPGHFRVDTIYNIHDPYKLFIAAGGFVDLDLGGGRAATSTPIYLHARYILFKRLIGAVNIQQGFSPISNSYPTISSSAPMFSTQEVRVGYAFQRNDQPENITVKLGSARGGDVIIKYSATIPLQSATYTFFSAAIANVVRATEVSNTTTDHYKWNVVDKSTGQSVDTNKVMTTYSMQQISAGVFFSKAHKFKGKFYLTFDDGSQRHKRCVRRHKAIFDLGMEMLYAPTMQVQKTPWAMGGNTDPAYLSQYEIKDIKYKRMGFRFDVDVKMSIFSIHAQFGTRPGPKGYPTPEERQKVAQRMTSNFYMQMGFGIAIGAL